MLLLNMDSFNIKNYQLLKEIKEVTKYNAINSIIEFESDYLALCKNKSIIIYLINTFEKY